MAFSGAHRVSTPLWLHTANLQPSTAQLRCRAVRRCSVLEPHTGALQTAGCRTDQAESWVLTSCLYVEQVLSRFEPPGHLQRQPRQLVWCGMDATVLAWEVSVYMLVQPCGSRRLGLHCGCSGWCAVLLLCRLPVVNVHQCLVAPVLGLCRAG